MKKYILIAGCFVAFFIGGLLLWNRLSYSRDPAELPTKPIEIQRFDTVTLEVIGMRFHDTYEIVNEPPYATVSRYRNVFIDGEDRLELDCMVTCDSREILKLLQSCSVGKWDGFHGKHPKGVRDGIMFNFVAVVNDGQIIRADGSENFPKGYTTFEQALNALLSAAE